MSATGRFCTATDGPVGNHLRFEITYGVQMPVAIDYEPDLEEAYDEGLEAGDSDLED